MKIVADENIPCVREAFERLGAVELHAGRDVTPQIVADADILLVRSVTRVDAALLRGSRVRFVATATIGTDHVDLEALQQLGIGFAAAPGSNANSVAEYVVTALLVLAKRTGRPLSGLRLGIVGVGNVGRRVAARARALGLMDPLLNDPPRARAEGPAGFVSLDRLLAEADIVTLHVPLVAEGPDRTRHLVDRRFVEALRPGAWLLNTARGAVAETEALIAGRRSRRLGALVCDVWEGEPRPSPDLVEVADLGTPHIAGYSTDGKLEGVRMIHEAACRHLGIAPDWDPERHLPPPEDPRIGWRHGDAVQTGIARAVARAYDIERDDRDMRHALSGRNDAGAGFDRLRREYPVRREFRAYEVFGEMPGDASAGLAALEFRIAENPTLHAT